MIRWILDRNWLSISMYAGMLSFFSAGIELVNQNFLGVIFSIVLGAATFVSRRITWLSIALIPVLGLLLSLYSAVPSFSSLELAILVGLIAVFASDVQRFWGSISSTMTAAIIGLQLGYQGHYLEDLLGFQANSEATRFNALLVVFSLAFLLFALAGVVGHVYLLRLRHVGSPQDVAYSAIRAGKLRLEIAKQNERLEIAKDLSELLVQKISAVVSVTEGGRYAIVSDPQSAERVLERSYQAGREAQAELRRLYDYLNSAIISDVASFKIDDLNELAVAYRELGFNTVISSQGESFRLNAGMELCVYKIVFEALQNVRKHAPVGTEVGVDFLWVEDGLQVLVKDNGIEVVNRQKQALGEVVEGYDAIDDFETLVSEFDGATLAALRDRAAIYKGRIEASRVAGVGFTLSAIFPNLKSLAAQGN
jgi:signal transduction histidine kinase